MMRLKLLFLPRYHCDPNDYRPVNPPQFPPLGISTLTTFLKQNDIEVEQDDLDIKVAHFNDTCAEGDVIDVKQFVDADRAAAFAETKSDPGFEAAAEQILTLTETGGFDVFGFSLMPTDNPSTASVALALAKVLRKKYGATIIIGGSVNGEVDRQMLETGLVDYRILGHPGTSAGEPNLLNFCHNFEKGLTDEKGEKIDLDGAAYIKNGEYTRRGKEHDDIDEITITKPSFDGLPMPLYGRELCIDKDGETIKDVIHIVPYFFLRGCPHRCAFCSHSLHKHWKGKDPELLAKELKVLSEECGSKYFYFHNSTINPTYKYAEAFADALIKHNVNILWSDCANFEPLDEPLLEKLKKAGALRMVFGFESANPKVLSYIHKTFTVDKAEWVLRKCKEFEIWPELDMISGFPYESETDVEASLRFLKKNKEFIGACSINKFWLEGSFLRSPEKYGIEAFDDRNYSHINWSVRGYDEAYGLEWGERIAKTNEFYDILYKHITENFITAPDAHRLFFLYKHKMLFSEMKK